MRGIARLQPLCRLLAAFVAVAMLSACADRESASGQGAAPAADAGLRIVSINPSLTAILIALGAGEALVGVDEFSAAQQPSVAHLPRVGGLFNPSLEAVAALEPDAVVVVPSIEQRDFVARLREMGTRVLLFENIELQQVLANITQLGDLVGRPALAAERVRAIESARRRARALTADRSRPRTLIVLQRDPVFAVGRGGFIDEMLAAAGGDNLASSFGEPYPQLAIEWLVDAGPEVLIDMTDEPGDPLAYWSRWPAIPAVASGRVIHLEPRTVTLPGPYLDRALQVLVGALHGPELARDLEARVGAGSGEASPRGGTSSG